MSEEKPKQTRRESFMERLIRRSLETVGGTVDSAMGRGKKSDALPSTGDLAERLRRQIDKQAQINQDGRKLAPHLIRLKYAWGQTSDAFNAALKRLQNELLVVAIDHINDNRYAALAPVKITSKADLLTTGFTMSVGFDDASLANAEVVEIPVEIYAKLLPLDQQPTAPRDNKIELRAALRFPDGAERERVLQIIPDGITNLTAGRTKENDLFMDDGSVSRHHASLVMTADGKLKVADIGSSNGTFLNGERIAYGKAFEIEPAATVSFGDVAVKMDWEIPAPPAPEETEISVEAASVSPPENLPANTTGELKIKVGSQAATAPADEPDDEQTEIQSELETAAADDEQTAVRTNEADENQTVVGARSAADDEEMTTVAAKSVGGKPDEPTDFTGTLETDAVRETTKLKLPPETDSIDDVTDDEKSKATN